MRTLSWILAGAPLLLSLCALAQENSGTPPHTKLQPHSATESGWQLAWSDEFNGSNGSSPDPGKWKYQVGGNGWGNKEGESYTRRPSNVRQENGNLVIEALRENYTGADGIPRQYTSGRIQTQGLFAQAFGRFEARMRLPLGHGTWPAFWLLGSNISGVGWPDAGEIDIMESIGAPDTIYSTLHGPGYSGSHGISAKYTLPAGARVDNGFHTYAMEWAPEDIKFFFDDHLIAERTPASLPAGAHWVYDHPFFILLNLAVGGEWPGYPDSATRFPQKLLVDYVRVYRKASPGVSKR